MGRTLCVHFRCANSVVQRLNSWDVGMLKIGCLLVGLLVARTFPSILTGPDWWYTAAVLAVLVPILWRVLPLYIAARIRERRRQETGSG